MHVEDPALLASVGSGIKLVDGAGDAAHLEDASQHQTTEACSNDRDGGIGHDVLLDVTRESASCSCPLQKQSSRSGDGSLLRTP